MCRTRRNHIRELQRTRRHLPLSIATTIASALLTILLNNCNSFFFLYNTAMKDIVKLQCVQNCVAKVVIPWFTQSDPLL